MKRNAPSLLILALVLTLAGPAWADDDAGTDAATDVGDEAEEDTRTPQERATEYFRQAREAYANGHFDDAEHLLARAFAHDQNMIYKYNRILALEGAGRFEEALGLLDVYGQVLRSDERFDDIDEIEEGIREAHEAALAAASPDEPVEPVDPPERPDDTDGPNVLALGLLGGGGVAVGAGLIFASGVLIGDTIERLEDPEAQQIYNGGEFDRDADLRTLRTHQITSVVLLAAGAGAAGAGAFFLVRGDDEQAVSLELTPEVGPAFTGAWLRARF